MDRPLHLGRRHDRRSGAKVTRAEREEAVLHLLGVFRVAGRRAVVDSCCDGHPFVANRLLGGLERRGLVRKRHVPRGKRGYQVYTLTGAGQDHLARLRLQLDSDSSAAGAQRYWSGTGDVRHGRRPAAAPRPPRLRCRGHRCAGRPLARRPGRSRAARVRDPRAPRGRGGHGPARRRARADDEGAARHSAVNLLCWCVQSPAPCLHRESLPQRRARVAHALRCAVHAPCAHSACTTPARCGRDAFFLHSFSCTTHAVPRFLHVAPGAVHLQGVPVRLAFEAPAMPPAAALASRTPRPVHWPVKQHPKLTLWRHRKLTPEETAYAASVWRSRVRRSCTFAPPRRARLASGRAPVREPISTWARSVPGSRTDTCTTRRGTRAPAIEVGTRARQRYVYLKKPYCK